MPRKPAKQRNPIRGATPARDYEIGDQVFFSFAGTSGEGLFIGQLREDAYRRECMKRFPKKLVGTP
jgi:hypothetical protein